MGNIKAGTTNEELKSVFERFCTVIEADVIKNFGFVHVDADASRGKINEILRELNGYDLNGSQIRVQLSTSGVRQVRYSQFISPVFTHSTVQTLISSNLYRVLSDLNCV